MRYKVNADPRACGLGVEVYFAKFAVFVAFTFLWFELELEFPRSNA